MTKEDIDRIASEYFDDKESEHEMDEVFDLAKKALEKQMQEPKTQMVDKSNFDIEQYKMDLQCAYDCGRASVEPKKKTYDANFLEFLFNVINPNEMEKYMAMYNSPNIPAEGSDKE